MKNWVVGADVEILLHEEIVAYGTVEGVGKQTFWVKTDGGDLKRFRVRDNALYGLTPSGGTETVRPRSEPRSSDAPIDAQAEQKGAFTEFQFLAHLAELTGLYIEGAKDDDPDWLAHLGSLDKGAVDFAHFVIALDGEVSEPCAHGTPKSKRCEKCVAEGVYTELH